MDEKWLTFTALFYIIVNYNAKQKFTIVTQIFREKDLEDGRRSKIKARITETAIAHKNQEK